MATLPATLPVQLGGTMANELTFFEVSGHYYDVESPQTSGSTNELQFLVVSALVVFTPRLAPGAIEYISNLDIGNSESANVSLAIAPVHAAIRDGELQTINDDGTPGVQLLSNSAILGLTGPLIYDVSFIDVVYASGLHILSNFAFVASTDDTPVDLSDPTLTRLPYA